MRPHAARENPSPGDPKSDNLPYPTWDLGLPSSPQTRTDSEVATMARTYCGYCWRRIFKATNGAWYHTDNCSVSCLPGKSSKTAFPGRTRT